MNTLKDFILVEKYNDTVLRPRLVKAYDTEVSGLIKTSTKKFFNTDDDAAANEYYINLTKEKMNLLQDELKKLNLEMMEFCNLINRN